MGIYREKAIMWLMIELCTTLMGNISNFMQKQTFFSCEASTHFRVYKPEKEGTAHTRATNGCLTCGESRQSSNFTD